MLTYYKHKNLQRREITVQAKVDEKSQMKDPYNQGNSTNKPQKDTIFNPSLIPNFNLSKADHKLQMEREKERRRR